jgi:ABC-type ATPase involved in cell division
VHGSIHAQFGGDGVYQVKEITDRLIDTIPKGGALSVETARFTQAERLFKTIDFTKTKLGSAALLRDILHPPNTLEEIKLRRSAIQELRENKELRGSLEKALNQIQQRFLRGMSVEDTALLALAPDLSDRSVINLTMIGSIAENIRGQLNSSGQMPRRVAAIGKLLRSFAPIKDSNSTRINELINTISGALQSDDSKLYDGQAVLKLIPSKQPNLEKSRASPEPIQTNPIESKRNTPWYVPALNLSSSLINPDILLSMCATVCAFALPTILTHPVAVDYFQIIPPLCCLIASAASLFLITRKTERQFQDRLLKSDGLLKALDAIGELDALLSLVEYEDKLADKGCLPKLVDSSVYEASYTQIENPILALDQNSGSVANDIELRQGRIMGITGPNSGGKSTLVNSLIQNQILAQLGTHVAAKSATVSIADKIRYQGPIFKVGGEHGKFGTEMRIVRDILKESSSRSLVILDEIGDGSAENESREIVVQLLRGFSRSRIGTVLVTHNRELIQEIARRGLCAPAQLGLEGGENTFRLSPGISPYSNAAKVAKELGITPAGISKIIAEKRRKRRNES